MTIRTKSVRKTQFALKRKSNGQVLYISMAHWSYPFEHSLPVPIPYPAIHYSPQVTHTGTIERDSTDTPEALLK